MVDLRPLLFINALCFMLLVTAGFAHYKSGLNGTTQPVVEAAAKAPTPPPVAEDKTTGEATHSESGLGAFRTQEDVVVDDLEEAILFVDQLPADAPTVAREQAPQAQVEPAAPAVAQAAPARPEPKTVTAPPPVPVIGTLTIRSNVVGDQVRIDGRALGATPVVQKLKVGTHTVEVTKRGYKPWRTTIDIAGGISRTLVAALDPSTDVNFVNGVWKDGVKTGTGHYQDAQGNRYEGEFLNGKFHGQGELILSDGTRYKGEWFEGHKNGYGTLTLPNGDSYTGHFNNDQYEGEGTLTLANGDIYSGHWTQGKLNGEGSLTARDGTLYVGGFSDNEYHGNGSLTLPDGTHYEGTFANGLYHGKGELVYADGKKYVGQFLEGKFHGQGILRNPNGSSIEGTFKFGKPYGMAKLTTPEGEVFTARSTEPGVCYRWKSYRATQCPPLEGW